MDVKPLDLSVVKVSVSFLGDYRKAIVGRLEQLENFKIIAILDAQRYEAINVEEVAKGRREMAEVADREIARLVDILKAAGR